MRQYTKGYNCFGFPNSCSFCFMACPEKRSRNFMGQLTNEIPASGLFVTVVDYSLSTFFAFKIVSYTIGAAINTVE